MNTQASGGVLAVLRRLSANVEFASLKREADEARVTVEAMAEALQEANTLLEIIGGISPLDEPKTGSAGRKIRDALAAYHGGTTPPATDAPDTIKVDRVDRVDYGLLKLANEQLRERLRNCEAALEERDAQLLAATPPAGGGDAEPPAIRDLLDAIEHCAAACDEGVDFAVGRPMLDALTTLGLLEKIGRGRWSITSAGTQLATRRHHASAPVEAWNDTKRLDWLEAGMRHYGDGHTEPRESGIGWEGWQQSPSEATFPGLRPAIDAAVAVATAQKPSRLAPSGGA